MSLPAEQRSAVPARSGRARLLIVDDEPEICGLVAEYLDRDGYAVEQCRSGTELDTALAAGAADLVLLDVSMPGEDGLSIARRLRNAGKTPILMLTSLDSMVDRIVGFEVGADDYLVKPFDLRELLARVRAILRRSAMTRETEPTVSEDSGMVPFGKVHLDPARRCLVDAAGCRIGLTPTEYYLLDTFARNANRVLSRERLFDNLPGRADERTERAVDVRIARIRRKIEADPSKPAVIRTIRHVGYLYVPSPR